VRGRRPAVADDIVTRLNCAYPRHGTTDCELCTFCLAKAEIERLRTENALLASYLYPVGMMLRPTALPADGIDGITAEEVEEFLEDDRGDRFCTCDFCQKVAEECHGGQYYFCSTHWSRFYHLVIETASPEQAWQMMAKEEADHG